MPIPLEDNNFEERMKSSSSAQKTGYGSGSVVIGEEVNAPPLDQSVDVSQSISESSAPDASTPTADLATGVDVAGKFSLEEWKRIATSGYSFAFIQNGEGFTNFVPDFDSNWENAKLVGLLRGAYHAFIAEGDPYNQADTFIKSLLGREDAGELPPVLGITRLAYARDDYPVVEAVTTWIERVEDAFGRRPILFCNSGILERLKVMNGGIPSWVNELPLWIAHQSDPLPESFKWTFWQHKIDGLIEGISLKIGFDYFNGSKPDLAAFARTGSRKQRLNFALNDRPEGPDRLNYEKYADAFAQVLAGRYTQTPLTVGVYASWGMGKSFLLGKIREKLKVVKETDNQLDFAFIDFNAWVYSGSENLWAGLVTKLYDGIEKHYESKGGRLVQDYRLKESLKQLWRTFIKSLGLVLVFGIPAALYSYFFYKNGIQESWADVVQVVLLILGGAPVLSKLPDLVKGLSL